MKKIITFCLLAFFIHFFIFRGLFTSLDSDMPQNTSGNLLLIVIEFIVTMILCCIIFIMVLIEKAVSTSFKYIYLFLLYLHCIFHFCCDAFFEYNLFTDSESFDTSSVCLLYTSPSPRDRQKSRMPSSA